MHLVSASLAMAYCAPLNPWNSTSANLICGTAGNAVPCDLFSPSAGYE